MLACLWAFFSKRAAFLVAREVQPQGEFISEDGVTVMQSIAEGKRARDFALPAQYPLYRAVRL